MKYCIAKGSDDVPYPLFGVNVELAKWIWDAIDAPESESIVRVAFARCLGNKEKEEELKGRLRVILGGSLGHDFAAAEKFMYDHWHSHVELGPYPCPYMLAEYQSDGVFYSEYRDHVAHQFKVYLLGLYLHDHCKVISDAFAAALGEGGKTGSSYAEEFCLRWLAASLAHDTGYLLEKEVGHPPSKGSPELPRRHRFADSFNRILEYPLLEPLKRYSGHFSAAMHDQLVGRPNQRGHLKLDPEAEGLDLCDSALGEKYAKRVWAVLNDAASKTGLAGHADNHEPLKAYYRLAEGYADCHGVRLLDHGINSALLVMAAWYAYRDAVNSVRKSSKRLADARKYTNGIQEFPVWAVPTQDGQVASAKKGDLRFVEGARIKSLNEERMLSIAGAIALHNVDPSRYDCDPVISDYLSDQSAVRLKDNPLAFLLRLTDTLQDWDRQKFRPLRSDERLLESRDFSLRAVTSEVAKEGAWAQPAQGRIALFYRTDFVRGASKPGKSYSETIAALEKCLSAGDVESLICFDGPIVAGTTTAVTADVTPDTVAAFDKASEFQEVILDPPILSPSASKAAPSPGPEAQAPTISPQNGDGGAGGGGKSNGDDVAEPIKGGAGQPPWLVARIRKTVVQTEEDSTDGIGACNRVKEGENPDCEVIWQSAHLAADCVCVSRASQRLVNVFSLFAKLRVWAEHRRRVRPYSLLDLEAIQNWIAGFRQPMLDSLRVGELVPFAPPNAKVGDPEYASWRDAEVTAWSKQIEIVLERFGVPGSDCDKPGLARACGVLLLAFWGDIQPSGTGKRGLVRRLLQQLDDVKDHLDVLAGNSFRAADELRAKLIALPGSIHRQLFRQFPLPLDESLGGRLGKAIRGFAHFSGPESPWHDFDSVTVPESHGGLA